MNASTKIAFAVVILMGLGSFPANALVPGQCTPWKSLLGGLASLGNVRLAPRQEYTSSLKRFAHHPQSNVVSL